MENLEDVYCDFTYEGKPHKIQLMPREVKLYEMVFPEERLDSVLSLFGDKEDYSDKFLWIKKIRNLIVKTIGLKQIPKWKDTGIRVDRPHAAVHLIGIKKDIYNKEGEML